MIDKRGLSERDICTKFITPALRGAGWDEMLQIPFAFSSNGDGFVFHDRTGKSTPREVDLPQDNGGPSIC